MNRFIVGIMLFKVRAMLCLGPLVWWWSLSPSYFNGSDADVWFVGGSDGYLNYYSVDNSIGLRPSISLKPSTNVTGNGTSDKPYKVI